MSLSKHGKTIMDEYPILQAYIKFKTNFVMEEYLLPIRNFKLRK